jgi:glycosyltransferase involved in cell wall biosynthesis
MTPLRPRVLYVQYTNPAAYPPLEHSARLLVDAGYDVALLGTSRPDDPLRFHQDPRIDIHLQPAAPAGWRQKTHYARFVTWALGWARRWQPTWIYASDPLAAPVALGLQRVSGARVIYHEHDSPDLAAPATSFMRAVHAARSALARRADLCVLPSAARAGRFAAETGAPRVETVWNCPRLAEVAEPRAPHTSETTRVLYHGSIVPARLPLTVVDAVAQVETVTLGIAGYETAGCPGYVASLASRAAALGVSDRVVPVGTLPSRDALMINAGAYDVGLALLPADTTDPNEQHMVGASNKPFDYLANGVALLVSDRAEWVTTFVEPGYARSCRSESASSLAAALRWFADHPHETRAMGERGRQRIIADWHYERTFAGVLRYMADQSRPVAAATPAYSHAGSNAGGR